jgi:hypothetical protein
MDIVDLNREQKIALVALLEALAVSDGDVSEAEEQEIGHVAAALGEDAYRGLLDEAEQRIQDVPRLKTFLRTIKDQAARELIYGVVVEEFLRDDPAGSKRQELLAWLEGAWDIPVEISPEGEGA